ncbi:hypothetical protein P3T76_003858 [Phytophthora citrophthora]|uniref:Serine protease n=1 Tax=Phytophthora citrophthora TaxID=4793 RepID=A0AAD9GUT8_9STRA|nr:hypothetical protein P3T76_003858 [Phytophthora citrophthora]
MGIKYTDNGIAIVGTTEDLNVNVTAGTSREDLISYEFASYIAVHFTGFNLPEGDSVVISSPDENVTVSHTYTSRGRDESGTFIASFIPGNSVTVAYKSVGTASAGQGYRITGFSRGYPTMQQESVCGDGDQSIPAKCYAPGSNLSGKLPQAYRKAQAVARLLINGTYLCTGWLGGSEGHLFTNHHCFEEEDWALNTDIEFMAESSSCSDQCELQLGCAGKLVATSATFIADSEDIDYSVVQLPDCVNLTAYGYLQLRESGPVVNESIYVPQHPVGYAKRIVSTVDNGDDTTIRSVGEDGNCGLDQVGHDADTQSGSSGSPLIASSDNLVVAIHHCGGCTNTAIDVRTVLNDLASKNITIKNLVAQTVGQNDAPLYARTPCTAQKPMKRGNHSTPCSHGSNSTTASNSTTKTTPAPSTSSSKTSSPVTTGTTTTTSTSTATSISTALTSASVVTSTKSTKTISTPSASTPVTTVTSTSTNSTTTVANSTTTTVTSTSGGDKSPSTLSRTVDNDTIVAKLKAALIGLSSLPTSTPATTTPKPTKPSLTPATVSSTPKPSATPAATVTSTIKPSTSSPTPTRATVTPVPTTKRSTSPASTPCSSVTMSSQGGWGDVEQN